MGTMSEQSQLSIEVSDETKRALKKVLQNTACRFPTTYRRLCGGSWPLLAIYKINNHPVEVHSAAGPEDHLRRNALVRRARDPGLLLGLPLQPFGAAYSGRVRQVGRRSQAF